MSLFLPSLSNVTSSWQPLKTTTTTRKTNFENWRFYLFIYYCFLFLFIYQKTAGSKCVDEACIDVVLEGPILGFVRVQIRLFNLVGLRKAHFYSFVWAELFGLALSITIDEVQDQLHCSKTTTKAIWHL